MNPKKRFIMKKKSIFVNGIEYVDYTESDLRFTGWEYECIIIDRTENHYLVPIERYKELKEMEQRMKTRKPSVDTNITGWTGITGNSGTI